MQRQQTDVIDDFPQTHPSMPQPNQALRPERERRVRPHKKYSSPEEMWAWHWVRMRVVLAWSMVVTTSSVAVTAGVVILSEFV